MWTIFFVQLVGLISPGPDFFYISRKAMSESRRNAMLASVGVTIGVGFWSLMVLFGLATVNRILPSFQFILMVLGGAYLAYNGFKMVQISKSAKLEKATLTHLNTSARQEIFKGLLINLSNPKIVVFFSSVLAGYVSNLSQLSDFFLVFLMLTGSSFIYFCLIGILLSQQKIQRFYSQYNHYLDNFAGGVFILFGSSLTYEGITHLL